MQKNHFGAIFSEQRVDINKKTQKLMKINLSEYETSLIYYYLSPLWS